MRSRCITDLFSSLILSHSLTYSFSLTTKKFFSQHYTAVVIVVSGQVYYLVEISSETFNERMRGKIRELHAQYSPLFKASSHTKISCRRQCICFSTAATRNDRESESKRFFFFTKALDFQLTIPVFRALPSKQFRVFFFAASRELKQKFNFCSFSISITPEPLTRSLNC